MRRLLLTFLSFFCVAAWCGAQEFEKPVRIKVAGKAIRVESPGYAAPCLVKLDGAEYLVVGQFNKGKMKAYKSLGKGDFAEGAWLETDGKPAEVPGVW